MKFKLSTEVKTAILVTATIALFIWGYNLLKGTNIFVKKYIYCAVYDHIDGLVENNPVLVNGYHIGQVKEVSILPGNIRQILVKFIIYEDLKIPKNTLARIYSFDLLGSKAVELLLGSDTVYAHSGDTLFSETELSLQDEVNRQVMPLKKKAEDLILSIDSVMTVVQTVLNKSARENLTKSFESIKRAIINFENTSIKLDELVDSEKARLHSIFSNIEAITGNIQNNNKAIANAINNISAISDTLARSQLTSAVMNTNKAMSDFSQILEKVNHGEGTLGMLLNNDSLYNNLSHASENLEILVKDIQEHPTRYVHFSVFGKKEKKK